MRSKGQNGEGSRSRLESQIDLLIQGIHGVEEGLPGAEAWPPGWADQDSVDYLYRAGTVLVRDADLDRVKRIVEGSEVEHSDNLRGLTRFELAEGQGVEDACARVDRALGEGVMTPDHVFYACVGTTCPATEPEEVPPGAWPDPGVSDERCDGRGVRVAVLDSGWWPDAAAQHSWLAGVDGDPEDPFGGQPSRIRPYAGHGTFCAGVLRTMAPRADVWVSKTFTKVGAIYESELVMRVAQALRRGFDIISLSFGSNTRNDIASLGFDVVGERLSHYPGVQLVAAAGNDSSNRPFWPAAFGWAVGVGALNASWRNRAHFSNYGPWVDVYAPGEGLVNAFLTGQYQCTERPNTGQWRDFDGLARWSGTSFATPLVAGLVAARMSDTGEKAPQAAAALLAQASGQALPGVGPVILPGQACGDRSGHGRSRDCAACCRCRCVCCCQ